MIGQIDDIDPSAPRPALLWARVAFDASKMAGGVRGAALYSPEPFRVSEMRNHINHVGKRSTQLQADVVFAGHSHL